MQYGLFVVCSASTGHDPSWILKKVRHIALNSGVEFLAAVDGSEIPNNHLGCKTL